MIEKNLTLILGPETVDDVDHLKFSTTLTNTGDEALHILNDPSGPMSNLATDKFTIVDPIGAQPTFTGVRAKYVPSIAAKLGAFTVLEPEKSVSVNHDRSYEIFVLQVLFSEFLCSGERLHLYRK